MAKAIADARRNAREELARYAEENLPPEVAREVVIAEQDPVTAILAYALEHETDLIVMGTHGRGGLQRVVMGSVAEGVLADASVPVLTVRSVEAHARMAKILCAVNEEDDPHAALDYAFDLATALDADLTILHAREEGEPPMRFEERVPRQLAARVSVERMTPHRHVGDEIITVAEQRGFDLIIVGGEHIRLVRHSRVPVLTMTRDAHAPIV
jgi:nucleotide-binding universal stress UspA family protein